MTVEITTPICSNFTHHRQCGKSSITRPILLFPVIVNRILSDWFNRAIRQEESKNSEPSEMIRQKIRRLSDLSGDVKEELCRVRDA